MFECLFDSNGVIRMVCGVQDVSSADIESMNDLSVSIQNISMADLTHAQKKNFISKKKGETKA